LLFTCPQAFEIVTRPAIDNFDSALDRVKMNIYLKFADWGLPCPITGHAGTVASQAAGSGGSQQPQQS
jgi:cytochrome c heme-lyase